MSDDAMGLTQREPLMELREAIKGLKATVDAIARGQALGVERRAAMQRSTQCLGCVSGKVRKAGRGERGSAEPMRVNVWVVDAGMLSTIRRSA